MSWIYKAVIQKFISFFPFSHRINFLLQRYISHGRDLPNLFVIDRIKHAQTHINSFEKYGKTSIKQIKILEIGTGWYPIVPIVFFLSGSNDIETTDIRKLYNRESINQTIRAFLKLYNNHQIFELIPNFHEERIESLKFALKENDILKKLKILCIKTNNCKFSFYSKFSNNYDLIVSNNTLQFIKKDYLLIFFQILSKLGKSNSILSCAIDFTDEFSHFDKSISNFNFLKFSDFEWNFISNRLSSANRLRCLDYQNSILMYFRILEKEVIQGEINEVRNLKFHKMFSQYNIYDLLVKHAYFACVNIKTN